jgi:lipase ATG15
MLLGPDESHHPNAQFFPNLIDPLDFSLSIKQISSSSSSPTNFKFIVGDETYRCNRNLAQTIFTHVNVAISNDPNLAEMNLGLRDPNRHFKLIMDLLAGDTISITEDNARFLHQIATTLGNSSLEQAVQPFLSRWTGTLYDPPRCGQKFASALISICCTASPAMRVIFFLCEIVGLAITFSFVFNLFMIPITSGVLSPVLSSAFRFLVMVPFILFNVNTTTIIELAVFYICTSNHFIATIPFPKHVQLIKLFAKVWPFCNRPTEIDYKPIDLETTDGTLDAQSQQQPRPTASLFNGKKTIFDTVIGALFFVLLFFAVVGSLFRYILMGLALYIPWLIFATAIVLYGLHAVLSCFRRARENFAQFGDFSDPFLCAMYFAENPWQRAIRRAMNGPNYDAEPLWKVVLHAIFSKFTAAVYVSLGLFALLVSESGRFTVLQAVTIVLLLAFNMFPLMASIKFPMLIVERLFYAAQSESDVSSGPGAKPHQEWLAAWFSWSRKAACIRIARCLWVGFYLMLSLIAIFPVMIFHQPAGSQAVLFDRQRAAPANGTLTNPVCGVSKFGMDILQLSALAESSYSSDDNETSFQSMLRIYFGSDWRSRLELIPVVLDPTWEHENIRWFNYTWGENHTHVISVRGTLNSVDVMADVELWASSFVVNVLKTTIPIFSGYADDSRGFLSYAMLLPRFMFRNFSLVSGYVELIEQVVHQVEQTGATNIIITGHSLGGGLSKLVAVMTGHQAVSFSGPGITTLSAFYEFLNDRIPSSFVNVVPKLDPVPTIDKPSGTQFLIPCEAGLFSCHDIYRTQCMLAIQCGQFEHYEEFCRYIGNFADDDINTMLDIGKPY